MRSGSTRSAGDAPEVVALLGAWAGPGAVGVLGVSLTLALGAAAAGSVAVALGAGAVAAVAATFLLAEGWIDPIAALVLVLPLPALYAAGGLRLPPAAPLTALVVLAWFLAWGPSRRGLRTGRVPLAAAGAFLGSQMLAGLLSPHRAVAARELVNLGVLLALLLVATDLIRRRESAAQGLTWLVAAVAGAAGSLAVLETVGVLPGAFQDVGRFNRAALGFGQPNALGMFLAIALPLVVHAARSAPAGPARVLARLALAAVAAGLLATFSRGAWLSVLLGTGVLFLVGEGRTALKVWALAVVAAVLADVASGGGIRETVVGLVLDWSVAQRASLMWAGVQIFLENPLLGVGPGGFAEEVERVSVLVPTLWDIKETPHNAYIQAAAEAGVVGLVAFVVFLGAVFRVLLRSARRADGTDRERDLRTAFLWSFSIVLVEGMVEWPFSHGVGQLVMLVTAAGCALAASPPRPGPEEAP